MEKRAAPLFSPGDESSPGPVAGSRKAERRSEANAERRSELALALRGSVTGRTMWLYPRGKRNAWYAVVLKEQKIEK